MLILKFRLQMVLLAAIVIAPTYVAPAPCLTGTVKILFPSSTHRLAA